MQQGVPWAAPILSTEEVRRQERDRFITLLAEARTDDADELIVKTVAIRAEVRREFLDFKHRSDALIEALHQELDRSRTQIIELEKMVKCQQHFLAAYFQD